MQQTAAYTARRQRYVACLQAHDEARAIAHPTARDYSMSMVSV
jgi:hypothetical protein